MLLMTKTFTQDDLIRYIYRETTTEETTKMKTALAFDEQLSECYHELSKSAELLRRVSFKPSESCLDKILSYSKSYDLHALR